MVNRKGSGLRIQLFLVAGFVALVLAGLAALMFIVVEEQVSDEFQEGVHYLTLNESQQRRVRGRVPVVEEYFSYYCIHCYNLDDSLDSWAAANRGQVRLERVPALGTRAWRRLGHVYYAAEELELLPQLHKRIFRAIHDGGRNLVVRDELARFLRAQGQDAEAFIEAMDSPRVKSRLVSADARQKRYQVRSVPTLIVNGTYMVQATSELGLTRMLDVVDFLLEQQQAETAPAL